MFDEQRLLEIAQKVKASAAPGQMRPLVIAACLGALVLGVYAVSAEPGATQTPEPLQTTAEQPGEAVEATGTLFIHVVGAVAAPGVYEVPEGGRVLEALAAAGGASADAELSALNLARPLVDGEQVRVPTVGEAETGAASGSGVAAGGASALVNLNTADTAALETLPGVGPSTAARIIADREKNGPFKRTEDLQRVSGIGPKRYEALAELVTVR